MSMEWSNCIVLKLIDLYREHECLWNPSDNDFKSKTKKVDAWNEISETLNCDPLEVKKKVESLLASFRRERQKQDVKGSGETYKSRWFAFKSMLFLMDKFVTKKTANNDEESKHESRAKKESQEEPENSDEENSHYEESVTSPPSPPTAKQKRKLLFRYPENNKKRQIQPSVAYNILKNTVEKRSQRDESVVYGEYIASKHRKYSAHARCVVEHLIGNILFHADMGNYEKETYQQSSSHIDLEDPL